MMKKATIEIVIFMFILLSSCKKTTLDYDTPAPESQLIEQDGRTYRILYTDYFSTSTDLMDWHTTNGELSIDSSKGVLEISETKDACATLKRKSTYTVRKGRLYLLKVKFKNRTALKNSCTTKFSVYQENEQVLDAKVNVSDNTWEELDFYFQATNDQSVLLSIQLAASDEKCFIDQIALYEQYIVQ